jgi:hypothetical protein
MEGIAGAPQRAARLAAGSREGVDEGGLADARLAVDQRDAPFPMGDVAQGAPERRQRRLPLEQVHADRG